MRPPPSCISAIRTDLTHCTNEPIFSPISTLKKALKIKKTWDVKSCESSAAFPQHQVPVGSKYQSQSLGTQNVAFTHKKMFGSKKIFVLHPVGGSRIRRKLLHTSPRCLRQLRANVTYLQSATIKEKQKSCQLKTQNDFKQQRNPWTLFDHTYSAREERNSKKIEAKNRLGAVSQLPSPAKAPAPGSFAALPVQPSLLLSSELYSNLQNVFFSCKNTRISPRPPHLGAHLS